MPDTAPTRGLVIAVLGAESTGKSCLTQTLAPRLTALTGLACHVVPEYLREWCEHHQRLPRESDQAHIAHTQAQRIAEAAFRRDPDELSSGDVGGRNGLAGSHGHAV